MPLPIHANPVKQTGRTEYKQHFTRTINCFIYTFFLFLLPPIVSFAQTGKPAGKPNIVLIVADDHGTDALGCYGNRVIKTPHLDQLAAEGVRFTNAFCTAASCSPSRTVILSGMHNHANGMYGLEHSFHHFNSFASIESLPVLLAKAGYQTARVGKFHVGPEQVYAFQKVLSSGKANDPASLGRNPVQMAELSKSFITSINQPFFLYFATDDPHRSNKVLPNGEPDFNTGTAPNPFGNRQEGYAGIKEVSYQPAQVAVPSFLPDTRESRAELAQYYQAVSRIDQGVGKLIEYLKASGKYENTVIIYISDNGIAFPGAKTTLYDAGIKLPCIVRSPTTLKKGMVQQGMISWTDITPTILEFAGALPAQAAFHGRSFKKLLEEETVPGWDEVYASHSLHEITMYYPMRAVRTRKYKLIYNIAHQLPFPLALDLVKSFTWQGIMRSKTKQYGKRTIDAFLNRPKFELYDLEKDPDEIQNLANSPAHQDVFTQLLGKLKHFQQQTHDPWIHKWEYE
ncbi:sulfatase [Rhodocytophaga rosea]|uniref:Sulfatase n=1 Tax=Rhodocytophaga rosea TaxID=2704465 RepID=A0A6C0GQV0_9BACT|nr:sulfatase [Rhodocytophaga rosea]QHT69942.1 sulfatase [Rhodocytophaga rosea]